MSSLTCFGLPWDAFVTEWYLGEVPAHPPEEVCANLAAVERHLPERVAGLKADAVRGFGVIAPFVDLGRILCVCEAMPGFLAVVQRLREGENSARSELMFASAFAEAGLEVELEPEIDGRRPDIGVATGHDRAYVEVITPRPSQAAIALMERMSRCTGELATENTGFKVEVVVNADALERWGAIRQSVRSAATSLDIQNGPEGSIFRKVVMDPLQPPIVEPSLPARSPAIGNARLVGNANGRGMGILRVPFRDERARRLLAAELKHLPRHTSNILAIDATSNPAAPKDWLSQMRLSFQPTRNRRIGAIAIVTRGMDPTSTGVKFWSEYEENPHALHPVPAAIATVLRARPEASNQGG